MTRSEFTAGQIQRLLDANAAEVGRRWRQEFSGKPPHYFCEECDFVADQRSFFEIDHVVACARGGTRNPVSEEAQKAVAQGDVAVAYQVGVNERVLCVGCNQAKKERQYVPPGAGYAYRRPEWDRNPDHVYHGRPVVLKKQREEHPELYNPKRYA
jgi:hypothetical protein